MLKKIYMQAALALLFSVCAYAQNTIAVVVRDSTTRDFLPGVSVVVKGTVTGAVTDNDGVATLKNMPDGPLTLSISFVGYNTVENTYTLPNDSVVAVYLRSTADNLDVVIVEGTRSNKSIALIPTRVEVLTEEIDEASTMDPSKIAHLITHSTGIQVQQTSATSNTANVRIQGLDGRYSQILKDGFPLYGGFSGSLSIMQIPPLDLRQVEYIKGGASTLYGGGAISGLINLISKEPVDETLLHINGSHVGAFDVNAFLGRKVDKVGFTLLAQRNTHRWFDADKDGFTDLPQLTKYNLNPKVFFYFTPKTKLSIGGTFTNETREGGDTHLLNNEIPDSVHFYSEKNTVNRVTSQLKFDHSFNDNSSISVRNSFNIFKRSLFITPSNTLVQYRFAGRQLSSFSEFAYTYKHKENVLITGVNFYTESFTEDSLQSPILRNEDHRTIGGFANYTFDIGKMVSVEAGFRGDYVFNQKFYALPRISALFKWTEKLTTRIGGGMGYRNPTIFNQEAELFGYRNVLPINKSVTRAEESYGGNIDVGYKIFFGEHYFLNINQLFFFTYLDSPLILADTGNASGIYSYRNANGFTQSYGAETFFKFGFYDFVFFAGYTYTNVTTHFNNIRAVLPLTPQHSLKGDLLYALPGKWRIGLDYEFKSAQTLSNGLKTKDYWTFGAVVEYTWKHYTFFGNVENYTNVRQTKYGSIISGPYNTPQFTEVWAPLDGIVFNAGLKIRL